MLISPDNKLKFREADNIFSVTLDVLRSMFDAVFQRSRMVFFSEVSGQDWTGRGMTLDTETA